ncbi:glutaredoxin family protein [Pseudoalteromonas phenolica]|uniref:glutaredoxin family protein n=1 Tax=Pseudoalteromonas phenolica TaxID=161398 RepID=UPI00110B4F21|nr:glutaredoxin family protein [Pseudoalteromonas phenolica]TMO53646.1 NrdH-redoxin [Pseudoalteromonas phenolica]
MDKFTLYHTEGCHLCEQALALLNAQLNSEQIILRDIVEELELVEKYQYTIPVVANKNNQELGWPFDEQKLKEFIN